MIYVYILDFDLMGLNVERQTLLVLQLDLFLQLDTWIRVLMHRIDHPKLCLTLNHTLLVSHDLCLRGFGAALSRSLWPVVVHLEEVLRLLLRGQFRLLEPEFLLHARVRREVPVPIDGMRERFVDGVDLYVIGLLELLALVGMLEALVHFE